MYVTFSTRLAMDAKMSGRNQYEWKSLTTLSFMFNYTQFKARHLEGLETNIHVLMSWQADLACSICTLCLQNYNIACD